MTNDLLLSLGRGVIGERQTAVYSLRTYSVVVLGVY